MHERGGWEGEGALGYLYRRRERERGEAKGEARGDEKEGDGRREFVLE